MDIDIRRAFGVYSKLSIQEYKELLYSIRVQTHISSFRGIHFGLYSLPNRYHSLERQRQNVEGDQLDIECWIGRDQVLYDISIHRLKEKPVGSKPPARAQIYYKGNLDNCYWEVTYISYNSNWATRKESNLLQGGNI
jgi:hypothetical protein